MVIEVSHSIKPFITNVNKPRVSIVNGSVSINNIGRIKALIIPKKIDPTIAPQKVTSKPEIRAAVKIIAQIFKIHRKTQPCNKTLTPFEFKLLMITPYKFYCNII